jgi:nucleolar complex protein 2
VSVTSALVSQWAASVRASGSLASLKQLVRAYRLACHYGDSEAQVNGCLHGHTPSGLTTASDFVLYEPDAWLHAAGAKHCPRC